MTDEEKKIKILLTIFEDTFFIENFFHFTYNEQKLWIKVVNNFIHFGYKENGTLVLNHKESFLELDLEKAFKTGLEKLLSHSMELEFLKIKKKEKIFLGEERLIKVTNAGGKLSRDFTVTFALRNMSDDLFEMIIKELEKNNR